MTVDLDQQASGGPADGERRRRSALGPCDTLRRRRRLRLAFLLFFRSSNRFLRFPSDMQNLGFKIVFVLLYLLKFFSVVGISKWFTSLLAMSRESLFWRMLFQFFGSVFYPASNGYKTRVGMVFPPFC